MSYKLLQYVKDITGEKAELSTGLSLEDQLKEMLNTYNSIDVMKSTYKSPDIAKVISILEGLAKGKTPKECLNDRNIFSDWKYKTERELGRKKVFPKVHPRGTLLWVRYSRKVEDLIKDSVILLSTEANFKTLKNRDSYIVFHLRPERDVEHIFSLQSIKNILSPSRTSYKKNNNTEALMKQAPIKNLSHYQELVKDAPIEFVKAVHKIVSHLSSTKSFFSTKGKTVTKDDIKPQTEEIILPEYNKDPDFYKRLMGLLQKVRDVSPLKELTFVVSSVYRDLPRQYVIMLENRKKSLEEKKTRAEREAWAKQTDIQAFRDDKFSLPHDYGKKDLLDIMVKYEQLLAKDTEQSLPALAKEMEKEIEATYPTKGLPVDEHHKTMKDAFQHCYNNAFDLSMVHLKDQVKNQPITIEELVAIIENVSSTYKLKAKRHGAVDHFHVTYL